MDDAAFLRREAAREASKTLASRPPTPINWLELTGLGAGGTYVGGPILGALAAFARLTATHQPARTAITLNELGRGMTAAAGAAGGAAQQLTPEESELLNELVRREMERER